MTAALVTGATGAVGPTLVQHLRDAGYKIRALVRQPSHLFAPDVEQLVGDITDAAAVLKAAAGVEIIFHLAAKLHINNPDPSLQAEYEKVNIGGTANVVTAAQTHDVARIVHFSTISVYGPTWPNTVTDETSFPAPASLYAMTKLRAEHVALVSERAVVLRLAAVYGPRIKGNYRRLAVALAKGRFVSVGPGDNRRTLIYDADVARAALLAATHSVAPRQIFNVTDGDIHTVGDIVSAIAQAQGRKVPNWHLPLPPVRWGVQGADSLLSLVGRRAAFTPLLNKLTEETAVKGDLIQSLLGFQPAWSLAAGWQATWPTIAAELSG